MTICQHSIYIFHDALIQKLTTKIYCTLNSLNLHNIKFTYDDFRFGNSLYHLNQFRNYGKISQHTY